jgi:hypothetical protein
MAINEAVVESLLTDLGNVPGLYANASSAAAIIASTPRSYSR